MSFRSVRSHRDLIVYKASMQLARDIYAITAKLPDDERFGLRSQLRRAACSIPMNIAEGYGRGTRKDYAHFVGIAKGSALEIETALELCVMLHQLDGRQVEEVQRRVLEIVAMLSALRLRLLGVAKRSAD